MAKGKKVGKKKARHSRHSKHHGTHVLPAHMLGKSLGKKMKRKKG